MSEHAHLTARGLAFAYGPRLLLQNVSLTLAPGDRLGIVGPNGVGKSTLFRLLAGELEPAAGSIALNPPDAMVGLMRQRLGDRPGETVGDYLARATGIGAVVERFDRAVAALAEQADGADEEYDLALTRYVDADAAGFDERIRRTLEQVGLDGIGPDREAAALSGGQRTKVNLAAILLADFDVLLLDEPTNDLDRAGLDLLESTLAADTRAMAVVSHDRAFLERLITSVYELEEHSGTGVRFNGGYAAWQTEREVARRHHREAYDEYNAKRSELQDRARTQKQWSAAGVRRAKNDKSEPDKNIRAGRIESSEKVASKAKQTERALERLERNDHVDAPWEPWELRLDFATAERPSDEIVVLERATVERGSFRLGPVDAAVIRGDRILITGANGSGKTTLLELLLGAVEPASGSQRMGPSVIASTLQQQRRLFDDAPTLLRGFTDAVGCEDQVARSQLAKLGLDERRALRPVADLSPGEQTRAALALFAARGANVLVLDEPTNHLDLPAIEQLEVALAGFPHTLLLVSHDRRLIENVTTTRHWHLDDGRLTEN